MTRRRAWLLTMARASKPRCTGDQTASELAERLVGRRCYVGWPFLIEAMVTRVVDGLFSYRRVGGDAPPRDRKSGGAGAGRVVREPMEPYEVKAWPSNVEALERTYARRGIITGPVNVVLTVRPIKVRRRCGRAERARRWLS